MDGERTKRTRRRIVSLRRKRQSSITGLQPGDRVTAMFCEVKWEWRLVVESENGTKIEHLQLRQETVG